MASVADMARAALSVIARPPTHVAHRAVETLPWMSTGSGPVTEPANLAAVMHATRLIVEPIATMPWQVRNGSHLVEAPRWISDPMLSRPDARFPIPAMTPATHVRSRPEFWSELILDALWNGAGFLLFMQDAAGAPVAGTLRTIPSVFVSTAGGSDGSHWIVGTGMSAAMVFDRDGRLLGDPRFRMVMLRGEPPYDPQTGRGLGVLQRAADDLEVLGRIQRYSSGVYRAGVPAGYLKSSQSLLTKEQADNLKAAWMAAHGTGDARAVAVLNATTDFQAISLSPEDMAVIESKRMSLLDVALAFGVPPYQLGASVSSQPYSNVESEFQHYVTLHLNPKATRLEALLSALLPAGQSLEVDFRGMLRGDTVTRMAYYTGMQSLGVMSPQMIAREEGFDPAEIPGKPEPVAPQLPPAPEEVPADDVAE